MLSSENPFKGDDPRMILRKHIKEELPVPRLHVSDLPEGLCSFRKKAAQKEPARRYRTVDEITSGLEPLSNKFGVGSAGRSAPRASTINLTLSCPQQHEREVRTLLKDLEAELLKLGIDLHEID